MICPACEGLGLTEDDDICAECDGMGCCCDYCGNPCPADMPMCEDCSETYEESLQQEY